ncbi:UNVERIFIED_CONTAM: hypothetical protein FKN15_032501 [Acipenser sinensis]
MIAEFKNPDSVILPLKFTFVDEVGADAAAPHAYSAFWSDFFACVAEGEEARVPAYIHMWQEEEWKSVGRILVKGYADHKYFPLHLAPAFTVKLIFGEHSFTSDILFGSFLLYLSQSERDLVSAALQGALEEDDSNDVLDLLNRMKVKAIPSQENLKPILLQGDHKELIQKPKYALGSMSYVSRAIFRRLFNEAEKMFAEKKPTTRKVLKLLQASLSTKEEDQSLKYLQQHIRGLDDASLRKMLRFMTGSDVICVEQVKIEFSS